VHSTAIPAHPSFSVLPHSHTVLLPPTVYYYLLVRAITYMPWFPAPATLFAPSTGHFLVGVGLATALDAFTFCYAAIPQAAVGSAGRRYLICLHACRHLLRRIPRYLVWDPSGQRFGHSFSAGIARYARYHLRGGRWRLRFWCGMPFAGRWATWFATTGGLALVGSCALLYAGTPALRLPACVSCSCGSSRQHSCFAIRPSLNSDVLPGAAACSAGDRIEPFSVRMPWRGSVSPDGTVAPWLPLRVSRARSPRHAHYSTYTYFAYYIYLLPAFYSPFYPSFCQLFHSYRIAWP